MQLTLRDSLPWATLIIENAGKRLEVPDILVDTGSASTLLSADIADQMDIHPSPNDRLYIIRGVGGQEVVYSRKIDRIGVGQTQLASFEIEIGGMDYGFPINGILGMDFLCATDARIDLGRLEIDFPD
jgi:hypothetical protein